MAPAIKNRLVGTIIIFALAVIFLPDMLDGQKQTRRDIIVNIPASPEPIILQEPQSYSLQEEKLKTSKPITLENDVVANDVNPSDDSFVPNASTSSGNDVIAQTDDVKTNPQSTLEQQTFIQQPNDEEATGWVIQLGSFKHQKNVRELMDKVEKAGYRVFSQPVETSVGKLNKVFVGPDLDKSKLEKSLSHLQEVTGLTGRVTPFTVK
ncbi:SPOR domain-containing protein [Opacimonas viscosa]|uniref:SPOR domain-containing protein n=1 Tax=Opacimonas viscosa TaxID=2961944 RepID=A0AA42BKY0_9ALTE|nr:SPOR domain-containing protein [Opacimonas viscosa]MCP3428049.1 SPOR domain-containing protein [Opacimonas viscosa]